MSRLAIVLTALLPLLATPCASAEPITFVTETYPPFNYREGDTLTGASVDQLKLIMKDTGIDYSMQIMPWARALALTTREPHYCIFTTVHNDERDKLFKWVEPLLKSRTILIRRTNSPVHASTLEEAKAYVIGTQRDDFTQNILEDNHFPKIDLATDLGLTMKKLLSGRIDMMPISDKYYDKLKRDGAPVEGVLTLAESVYSIACNRSVDDAVIRRMQANLDRLIADGTQDKIFAAYGLAKDQ